MARYRFSIDLGAFIGVRFRKIKFDENGPEVPCLCIPVGINGMAVAEDTREVGKRNPSGLRVFLNFTQRLCNNKYIDAVKQSLMRRGEEVTLYNVPAFQVCYTLKEEVRTKIRAALAKKVIADHPEWGQQSDTQGTDLSRAISTMMPFQMGDSYLVEEQSAASAPRNSNTPVSQGVAGYSEAMSNNYDPFGEGGGNDDDLPF